MDKATLEHLIHYARRLVNGPYKDLQGLGVTGDDLVNDVVEKYLRDAKRGVDRSKENLGYHRRSIRNKAKDYFRKKRYQVGSDELENYVQEAGGFLQDPTVTASEVLRESIDGVSPGAASPGAHDPGAHDPGARRLRDRASSADQGPHPAREDDQVSEQARQRTKESLSQVAKACEEMAWTKAPQGRVDRYAVFLLHLRLVFAADFGKEVRGVDEEVARFIEERLSWSQHQEALVIKKGWPPLGELWASLREEVTAPPHRVDSERLSQRVRKTAPQAAPLTAVTWYQWVKRAKKQARQKMGEARWEEVFGPFLETSKRSHNKRSRDEASREKPHPSKPRRKWRRKRGKRQKKREKNEAKK